MTYQRDRDDFIARMAKRGHSVDLARKLLRYATTLHRLAESECNGDDWQTGRLVPCPGDGTKDSWCGLCGGEDGKHDKITLSSLRDEQCAARVRKALVGTGIEPVFNGDPRGTVFKLKVPGDSGNDWGGEGLVCVPTR
jgi:hypothetical protein